MSNPARMPRFAATVALLLLLCPCGRAGMLITDGNSLLRFCEMALKTDKSSNDWSKATYLLGYLDGILDAQRGETAYKIPAGITPEQIIRVIRKWLEEHPKTLQEDAGFLIILSLIDAYPSTK